MCPPTSGSAPHSHQCMYFSATPQAWPMPGRHILASDAMMSIARNVTICHLRVCEDKMSPLSSSLMEQLYGEKKVSISPQQSRNIYQDDLFALSCSPLHSLTVFISSPVINTSFPSQPQQVLLQKQHLTQLSNSDKLLQKKKKNPIYFSMSQDSGLCALMISEACLQIERKQTS